jgi:hypothetical protein
MGGLNVSAELGFGKRACSIGALVMISRMQQACSCNNRVIRLDKNECDRHTVVSA